MPRDLKRHAKPHVGSVRLTAISPLLQATTFSIRSTPVITALILLLSALTPARALDPHRSITQYAHRIWGQEEGLFQPTVYSIIQTRDGFLWLGTQDSLIRFDGAHFREFLSENGQPVLPEAVVRSLYEDGAGNLWAASIGSGLAKISPSGEVSTLRAPAQLPSDNLFCVDQSRSGAMWICTDKGLWEWNAEYRRLWNAADGLPGTTIRGTCETTNGTRWAFGVGPDLVRWTGSHFVPGTTSLPGAVDALLCARDGTIWAGTTHGLVHLLLNGKAEQYTEADGLPDNAVGSLSQSNDGSIWIGTEDGISRWREEQFSVYRTRDGLSHSLVLSLFTDREGTLWAGTKDGLDQFTTPKLTPYTTSEGLPSNQAGPIVEDKAGHLWVGTADAGLAVYDGHCFRSLNRSDGLLANTVLSLAAHGSGDIWVGTSGGLNRVHNGRVVDAIRTAAPVQALQVDARGQLWVGSGNTLAALEGDRLRTVASQNEPVLAIGATREGSIMVNPPGDASTAGGRIGRPITSYLASKGGDGLWMSTLGAGLVRSRGGVLTHIRTKDGLWDNRIYSMLRDGGGNVWMASSKGIFRLSEHSLDNFADGKLRRITSVPFTTGQLRFQCRAGVQPAACRTHDGRLWFATTNGLVVLDPLHLDSNTLPPPVQITGISVDGALRRSRQSLRVRPRDRNISIRYAGLSFISPEKVAFRYILDGYSKSWVDAGTRREAFFSSLPPGEYHFRVQARNADGVWSHTAADLPFTVDPMLFQRPWFFPAAGVLLASLGLFIYRARMRRLEHGFNLVLGERNRIARELHDTLLQGISGVTMQLQALWRRMPASREREMLGDIISDAGECSKEARRSLWCLREPTSDNASLSQRLLHMCEGSVASTGIRLHCRIDAITVNDAPELEFQLLRIAREALTNVVRHAEATTVSVLLQSTCDCLTLLVQDNGKGFDETIDHSRGGHFGVTGMRERAAQLGAELLVTSDPSGTTIAVKAPLRRPRQPANMSTAVLEHR